MRYFFLTVFILFFSQLGFPQDYKNDPASKIIQNLSQIESLYFKNLNTRERQEALRLVNETRTLVVENVISKEKESEQKDLNILSEEGFKSLMASVKNESSDRSKTKLIMSIGKNGKITSAQAAQFVALYKFDRDREDLLKSISDNIIDPVNIGLALKYIDSSSIRDKLVDYYRNK